MPYSPSNYSETEFPRPPLSGVSKAEHIADGGIIIAFLGYNPLPKPEARSGQLVWYRMGKGNSAR